MVRRYGAEYDSASQILVTVGVSEALDLAIRAICEPGDEVLYHEPCFVSYNPTIRMAHAVPVAVETFVEDDFRLTVEELEKKVTPKTKALLLNFPCNPTGAALTRKDMDEIAAFVLKHDLLLIADEVYSELAYDGEVKSFASNPALKDNLVVLNGFSKAWAMTGYRLGFACGPVDIIDTMMKIHQYGIMSAPTLSQFAGVEAMDHGDDDIAMMREEYRRRRNYVVSSLNEIGLKTFMPEGAFYVFPDIRSTGLDSQTFAMRMLEEHAVACVPGGAFGACGEGFVRCSYATSMEKLKTAMERFADFAGKLS
jgi:aminotransferase